MRLTQEQLDLISSNSSSRNGLVWKQYMWPNGIVPYLLSQNLKNNETRLIKYALQQIESETCINFVQREKEKDYIHVTVNIFVVKSNT